VHDPHIHKLYVTELLVSPQFTTPTLQTLTNCADFRRCRVVIYEAYFPASDLCHQGIGSQPKKNQVRVMDQEGLAMYTKSKVGSALRLRTTGREITGFIQTSKRAPDRRWHTENTFEPRPLWRPEACDHPP
jgi:hypothetical protein